MYNFNLKWLFIKLVFFASICVGNGHASEGETYRLSAAPSEFTNVPNNFQISDDGRATYYLDYQEYTADGEVYDDVRLFRTPTLGGSREVLSPVWVSVTDFLPRDPDSVVHTGPLQREDDDLVVHWGYPRRFNAHPWSKQVPIKDMVLSPDKRYVLYKQDGRFFSRDLNSVSSAGNVQLDLSGLIGFEVVDYKFAPNGRVFFRADDTRDGLDNSFELFSILTDGTDLIRHDGGFSQATNSKTSVLSYEFSPDGRFLVYRSLVNTVTNDVRLISASLQFSGSVQLAAGGPGRQVTSFKISPDGQHVVYRLDKNSLGVFELFVRPIDGSTAGGKLNPSPFPNTADVFDFAISPDSNRVVYIADQDNDNVRELYSTSIIRNGGPFIIVRKLNPAYTGSKDVSSFKISGDSQSVYYRANQDSVSQNEVYRVPINSGASRKLNRELNTGENIGLFKLSQDGSRLVYTVLKSGPDLLYSVETNGGDSVLLTRTVNGVDTGQLGVVDFKLSPDNATVVFTAGPFGQRQLFAHSFRRGGEMCLPIIAKNGGIAVICL